MSLEGEGRQEPLYSVRAIVWSTLLGSVLAGGILMAINYQRLGEPEKAKAAIGYSVLGLAALFVAIFVVPEEWPVTDSIFWIVQYAVIRNLAMSKQGPAIAERKHSGVGTESPWQAFGIGLACMAGIVAIVGIVVVASGIGTESQYIEFNEADMLYFIGEASKDDAEYVGRVLTGNGVLGFPGGSTTILRSIDGVYELSFAVEDGAWNDPEVSQLLGRMRLVMANERFGSSFVVHLCNADYEPQVSLGRAP